MNNPFSVMILPQAESDADSIFDWLFQKSPQGALRWYDEFQLALHDLVEQGDVFALAPEAGRLDRRIQQKLFSTPRGRTYRILYEIDAKQLFVLHIRAPGQMQVPTNEIRRRD